MLKPAWKGELQSDLGTIRILSPATEEDALALELLSDRPALAERNRDYRLSGLFSDKSKLDKLIEQNPNSRYAAYARYFRAIDHLIRFEETTNTLFLDGAISFLEGIQRPRFGPLFQELVLFHLIKAHEAAGSPAERMESLITEFKEKFPDSPYTLPELPAAKPKD